MQGRHHCTAVIFACRLEMWYLTGPNVTVLVSRTTAVLVGCCRRVLRVSAISLVSFIYSRAISMHLPY